MKLSNGSIGFIPPRKRFAHWNIGVLRLAQHRGCLGLKLGKTGQKREGEVYGRRKEKGRRNGGLPPALTRNQNFMRAPITAACQSSTSRSSSVDLNFSACKSYTERVVSRSAS